MTPRDADAFTHLLVGFDLNYPRAPISAEAKAMYFRLLSDLALADVERGVMTWLRGNHPFPPSSGELRTAAIGSAEDHAVLAWARVKRAVMAGLGYYRDLDFGDPVLHATVLAMGGWGVLYRLGFRDTEGVDWVTARKEFLQLYGIHERRGAPADTPCAVRAVEPGEGRKPAVVPLSAAAIERPPVRALPPAPERPAEAFTPSREDINALVTDLTKRASVVETEKRRPRFDRPRFDRPPLTPVTAEDEAAHRERIAREQQRLKEGTDGQGHQSPNGANGGSPPAAADLDARARADSC